MQETYPNLPNYGGEKYIYFETKEVREDTGVVEDATNEKDPIFDDGNIPEDEDSSDDSSYWQAPKKLQLQKLTS